MNVSRIALLAALGIAALALPAAAAPSAIGGTDATASKPALMQLAQNATRAASEARGGDFKKAKKKKKSKKKM